MRIAAIISFFLLTSFCFADLTISDCDDATQWGKFASPETE